MSIKKLAFVILAVALIFTGCSNQTTTTTVPDYQETTAAITAYEDAYRDFVQNGEGQVAVTTSSSQTPNGAPCNARFTAAVDQPFTSCSLEVTRNNRTEYDEYFAISDTMMMAVRTYIDDNGYAIINKYIATEGNLYLLNSDTSSCDLVEDVRSLDFFLSFEQVTTAYAGNTVE